MGSRNIRPGRVLIPEDEDAPVILEVMAKREIDGLDVFQARAKGCQARFEGPVLQDDSVYGDTLSFDTSAEQAPTINGEAVDDAPAWVYDRPFLGADYDSGIVTIRKGEREKVIDIAPRHEPRPPVSERFALPGMVVTPRGNWAGRDVQSDAALEIGPPLHGV